MTDGTLMRMPSYFSRHTVDKRVANFGNDHDSSPDYLAWLLWSEAGQKWAHDEKKSSDTNDNSGPVLRRLAETAAGVAERRVECSGDCADHEPVCFSDAHMARIECHGAIIDQFLKSCVAAEQERGIEVVGVSNSCEVDAEIAHQPLDHLCAEPVLRGQSVSLCGGQPSIGDPRCIKAQRNFILNESLGEPADR